jgi:hypothetical protein
VINGVFCDHSDDFFVNPFPEHDVLVIDMGFDLLLGLDVEDLEGTRSWTSSQYCGRAITGAVSGTCLSTPGSLWKGA